MRIVFIDMHCINFVVNTFPQIKSGTKIKTFKHKFLVDYALSNGIEVCNYISQTEKTISRRDIKNLVLSERNLLLKEHNIVINYSYGDSNKIRPIFDINELQKEDFIIGYFYKKSHRDIIKTLPGHRVMFGNHFISINEPVDLDELGIEAFINEIDLSDNKFVNKYIKIKNDKHIVCPLL